VKDIAFHVHRLRHTYACRYLEAGGTLERLQRILGHSTIKLTECYGRLRPHAVAAEVARINRAITGTITGTMTASESSEARKSL
jgi:site-specific recombinase XerD